MAQELEALARKLIPAAVIFADSPEHVADLRRRAVDILAAPDGLPAVSGSGEQLARRFHEVYERLAPSFGYETRAETRDFDPTTPNGRLMIAVCEELAAAPPPQQALSGGRPGEADMRATGPNPPIQAGEDQC